MVEFARPTAAHVAELAANMRAADLVEIAAQGVANPHLALAVSLRGSSHSAVGLIDGRVAAIFGVVPVSLLTGTGSPWLLGTDLVRANPRALLWAAERYIPQMLHLYPVLENYVHAGNRSAVRFLKAVGFTLDPAAPHGPVGALFHRFEMRA